MSRYVPTAGALRARKVLALELQMEQNKPRIASCSEAEQV